MTIYCQRRKHISVSFHVCPSVCMSVCVRVAGNNDEIDCKMKILPREGVCVRIQLNSLCSGILTSYFNPLRRLIFFFHPVITNSLLVIMERFTSSPLITNALVSVIGYKYKLHTNTLYALTIITVMSGIKTIIRRKRRNFLAIKRNFQNEMSVRVFFSFLCHMEYAMSPARYLVSSTIIIFFILPLFFSLSFD